MPMSTPEEQREYQRKWVAKRRQDWIDGNGPCQLCGSDLDLEIDHLDPATKSIKVSSIWSWSKARREAELAKCRVLCRVCHKNKTKPELSAFNQGECHPQSKLTEADVLSMRSSDKSVAEIALQYGLHIGTVRKILTKQRWKHI